MKIYIAGAIGNNPGYEKQFGKAERMLLEKGYEVINPAKNQGYSYKEYIDIGLFELMHCEGIYMLDGWQKSPGACLEHHYAHLVGFPIYFENGGCK